MNAVDEARTIIAVFPYDLEILSTRMSKLFKESGNYDKEILETHICEIYSGIDILLAHKQHKLLEEWDQESAIIDSEIIQALGNVNGLEHPDHQVAWRKRQLPAITKYLEAHNVKMKSSVLYTLFRAIENFSPVLPNEVIQVIHDIFAGLSEVPPDINRVGRLAYELSTLSTSPEYILVNASFLDAACRDSYSKGYMDGLNQRKQQEVKYDEQFGELEETLESLQD